MGKQQRRKATPKSEPVNSIDWELRAYELYLAGRVSIHALTRPLPKESRNR